MARPLRYGFILAGVAVCAGLAAAGGWRYARASSPVNGPIILISADSLRADHLRAYGYTRTQTPAIDTLAADGIVFEHAYAHSPETLPAHASMLTGRLPVDTGARDDQGFAVRENERLLAELLHDRGYATAAVVSTFALRKESGVAQGFTVFDDKLAPAPPDVAVGEVTRDATDAEKSAEQWLDAANLSRCFLFLELDAPRAPYADSLPTGDGAYDDGIDAIDASIGRLVKYLKAHQLYDRSTILLTSDHGEGLGTHGELGHGLFVYEEALHVPLIVKQAAGEGAGRRVVDLVQHVDIVPTLLDLAKAPDPGNLRGQSLKPLLDGTAHLNARTVYGESFFGRYHFGWHELMTVTDGRYRYIRAPREELYDLLRDPKETHNIVGDATAAAPLAALRAAADRFKSADLQAPAAVSEADRERFEALGDVGRPASEPADVADLTDPKDAYAVLVTYRAAVDLALTRQWTRAIEELQTIVREHPDVADVWREIAVFAFDAGKNEQAVDAYKRVASLVPGDVTAQLGATAALARLRRWDEARQHAQSAADLADDQDVFTRSSAHEWLARIAVARHDAAAAREEAGLAKAADPALPLPLFVDGRLLYEQGRYADALPLFEQAGAEERTAHSRPVADLHYYLADCLTRLDRADAAEGELLLELKAFPQNTRTRAALATLEHNAGRDELAQQAMDDLVRVSPTADTYSLAARLWTSFGDRQKAAEVLRLAH